MNIFVPAAQSISTDVLAQYVVAAIKYGETERARDFRAGNKFADIVFAKGKLLRDTADGQRALQSLLTHLDEYVRIWAAKDCLFFAPNLAIPVLEELAKVPGLQGFAAEMTLKEWRAGRLIT
jgi:hypothetical protein